MSTFYMDNYTSALITKPSGRYPKGEMLGKRRNIIDRKTLVDAAGTAGLDVDDVIYGPIIPADSIMVELEAHIDKSLGATGIFKIGHTGYTHSESTGTDLAADDDAFIATLDAGGQAALGVMAAGAAGKFLRFEEESQVIITCIEVMDDTVIDGILTICLEVSCD